MIGWLVGFLGALSVLGGLVAFYFQRENEKLEQLLCNALRERKSFENRLDHERAENIIFRGKVEGLKQQLKKAKKVRK